MISLVFHTVSLRWPGPGFPGIYMAMDTWSVVVLVEISALMARGLSMESITALFPSAVEDAALDPASLDIVVLEKGEGIYIPFGSLCLHAPALLFSVFAPSDS